MLSQRRYLMCRIVIVARTACVTRPTGCLARASTVAWQHGEQTRAQGTQAAPLQTLHSMKYPIRNVLRLRLGRRIPRACARTWRAVRPRACRLKFKMPAGHAAMAIIAIVRCGTLYALCSCVCTARARTLASSHDTLRCTHGGHSYMMRLRLCMLPAWEPHPSWHLELISASFAEVILPSSSLASVYSAHF